MDVLGLTMGSEIPEGDVVTALVLVAETISATTGKPTLYLSVSDGLTSWGAAGLFLAGFDQARSDVADGWEPD